MAVWSSIYFFCVLWYSPSLMQAKHSVSFYQPRSVKTGVKKSIYVVTQMHTYYSTLFKLIKGKLTKLKALTLGELRTLGTTNLWTGLLVCIYSW